MRPITWVMMTVLDSVMEELYTRADHWSNPRIRAYRET